MTTLGLNIIVGTNDGEKLDNCLNSVTCYCKKLFDEIVVTITSTTNDRLYISQVAQKYNAKIGYFPWIDDFSAARNFSFSLTTTDYVFWLDSDDVLTEKNYNSILELKEKDFEGFDCILLDYNYSHDEDGNPANVLPRERILRMSQKPTWFEPIHEYIHIFEMTKKRTYIAVDHLRHVNGKKSKASIRNLEILRKKYEKGDISQRLKFYYARDLSIFAEWDLALPILNSYIKEGDSFKENVVSACIIMSIFCFDNKDFSMVIDYCKKAIEQSTLYAEVYVWMGQAYEKLAKLEEAEKCYITAANTILGQSLYAQQPEFYNFIPLKLLAVMYNNHNNKEQAKIVAKKALTFKQDYELQNILSS